MHVNSRTALAAAVLAAVVVAASNAQGAWSVNTAEHTIQDGAVRIRWAPDAANEGGIVLVHVLDAPNEKWNLDSLSRIEADTGLKPTAIGDCFATRRGNLCLMTIPPTLREIRGAAFRGCYGLHGTIDFSKCPDLRRIDPVAFMQCKPERVVFGEAFKRRLADALAAADRANGYPRASTDWLAGSFGIGVHWTTWTTDSNGNKGDFEAAVDAFDVPRFVGQVKEAGARHIIFTSSWAEQHPPAPCAALDRILPGRTTKRNLLKEIADSLAAEGIKTILYYNHGCNGEDREWMKACGYADANLETFGTNIVSIVRDLSLGCGANIAGWWFDSPGAVSDAGPYRVASVRLGDYKFPFRELALAAKAGNRRTLVSVNSQGGTFVYTPCQEYFSGEELVEFPLCGRTNAQGMQMHLWLTMDNRDWVHTGRGFAGLRFDDAFLGSWISRHVSDGCAVTLNVDVDRTGLLNPAAISQLRRVAR